MDQSKIIIGRILSADFRVNDSRISRIHALIERLDDGTLRVTDLASTHGTFVNGTRVVEKIVQLSDTIQLASLDFKIKYTQAPATREETQSTAPASAPETVPVQVASAGPATQVKVRKGDPTVIRSLKETARTRGVLDPVSGPMEELELTVYWEETILAVDHYRAADRVIKIGDGPGNNYIVPSGLLQDGFELIRIRGASAELQLHSCMKGSVRVGEQMQTLEELQKQGKTVLTLSGSDIGKIRVGTVNFFLMFVPRPPAIPMSPLLPQDRFFWTVQATVLVLAALLMGALFVFRQPIEGRVVEMPERLRRVLIEEYAKEVEANKIVSEAPLNETPPSEVKNPKTSGTSTTEVVKNPDAQMKDDKTRFGGNEGEGARERGKEGKRGLPDAKNETGITNRPKVAGATKTFDGRTKSKNPDKAPGSPSLADTLKNTGLASQIGKLAGSGGGQGGGAQGNDPFNQAFSGVGGGGIQSGRGSGGSGLQGTGQGGGGTAVGVGGLGTKGFGGGARGTGTGSIPGKGEFAIGTEASEVQILGSLTREEIERVVNAHRNEIDFCYQRELQRDSRLSGKMAYQWTIIDQGQVESVKATNNSTGSRGLESCIRDKVKGWRFPSPAKGSKAVIDWTWSFKPRSA
jgi:hypothetical protein